MSSSIFFRCLQSICYGTVPQLFWWRWWKLLRSYHKHFIMLQCSGMVCVVTCQWLSDRFCTRRIFPSRLQLPSDIPGSTIEYSWVVKSAVFVFTVLILTHQKTFVRVCMYVCMYVCVCVCVCIYIYIYIYIYIQGVPGGMCQTSGGCSLC